MMGSFKTVTYDIDGLETSAPTIAILGMPFTASFSCLDDKQFLPSTVRVMMNGLEVTDSTFNIETNIIYIPSVTGDITIHAEAATVDATLLSTYDILPYIGVVNADAQPGIRFNGIQPTEKTKFYTSFRLWGKSAYLISQPNKMMSSNSAPIVGVGDISNYAKFSWNGTRSGNLKPIHTYVQKRVDIICDKGLYNLYCKSMNGSLTYNGHVDNITFTGTQLTMLGNTTSTAAGASYGDIYELTHWIDDVLSTRYVPVKRKSDGRCGMLDIYGSGGFAYRNTTSWLPPYIRITNSYTNCSVSKLGTTYSGWATSMVIGQTWSYKYTPTAGYCFGNEPNVTVMINGIDQTSNVMTYDASTDTCTITYTAHWNDTVSITAISESMITTDIGDMTLSSQPRLNQSYNASFTCPENTVLLPSTVRITMDGVDVTDDTFNYEINEIQIATVTGNLTILGEYAEINSNYRPIMFIRNVYVSSSQKYTAFTIPYYANNNTYIDMDIAIPSNSANTALFGSRITTTSPYFYFCIKQGTNDRSLFAWGTGNGIYANGNARINYNNIRQNVIVNQNSITYTDVTNNRRTLTADNETFQLDNTRPLDIGGAVYHSDGYTYITSAKIFRTIIKDGNVLQYDLIPCKAVSSGLFGLYDMVNDVFYSKPRSNWQGEFVNITRNLSNCTQTSQGNSPVGWAFFGETWTSKFTPASGYTFNDSNAVFTVTINNVDMTSTLATYNETDGTYTIALTAHWGNNIVITAQAAVLEITNNITGTTLSNANTPVLCSSYVSGFTVNDASVGQILPSTIKVIMGSADVTETAFNPETNEIDIANVTGSITITGETTNVIPVELKPIQYIRNTNLLYNSTKYRYFDTGYYPTDLTVVEHDFNFLALSNNGGLMGAGGYEGTPYFAVGCSYSDLDRGRIAWGNAEYTTADFTVARNLRQTLTFGKGTLTCYNSSKVLQTKTIASTLATPWTSSKTFTIGGFQHSANVYRVGPLKLYGCKIYEDNVLQQNWVPCLRLSDNFVGFYDIENNTFITEKTTTNTERCDWIRPHVLVTRTLTNCTQTMLTGLLASGNASMAIIGETWSCKFAPIGNCTFNSQDAIFQVMINGVDKTNDYATYDSSDDSWTVSLIPHWKDAISINSTPAGIIELAFIGNSWTDSSRVERAIALEIQSSSKGFYTIQNGSAVAYSLPDNTVVKYDGIYYKTLSNRYLIPYQGA